MPDALMKTVPIWCAVFNLLLFPDDEEAGRLFTPPKCVSANEHEQILKRIPGFVADLANLRLDLSELRSKVRKPLRPIWVTRESELPETPPRFEEFHPIVLCTASKRVVGGEISEGGYIQGAGDDAEGWSQGLTPAVFWNHHDELMNTSEEELPERIAALTKQHATEATGSSTAAVPIKNAPWLSIGPFSSLNASAAFNYDAIITIGQRDALPKTPLPQRKHLHLETRSHKLGSRDLRTQLQSLRPFIQALPSARRILVCEHGTGTDLAPGVALALLCLYADENGIFHKNGARNQVDKTFIKQRLSWIMTSHPAASPSRATLQSINDYLLTEYTKPIATGVADTAVPASMKGDPPLSPAETIFHELSGKWTLHREIVNHRDDGLAGTVKGTATFAGRTPTDENTQAEYLYHEEGLFDAGKGIQMNVNRRWIWRLSQRSSHPNTDNPSISIHFVKADGETEDYLYNRLPLASEPRRDASGGETLVVVEAEHPCGRDFYVSKYTFYLRGRKLEKWEVRHEVKGPAKDYVSTTVHTREMGGSKDVKESL